ncbi:MAG: hypothetical protein KDA60_07225 [Planctomycetales bacterium]|nr:hypothetical protein [Planctomycetales bacterium]
MSKRHRILIIALNGCGARLTHRPAGQLRRSRWSTPAKWVGILAWLVWAHGLVADAAYAERITVGVFDVDASPPVGTPLAYDECVGVAMSLRARGVVLTGDEQPIVLCAVDWIGIANEGQTEWKRALAEAAGTTPERVSVHTLHQHDAPVCDFTTASILDEYQPHTPLVDERFVRQTIERTANSVRAARENAKLVTHVGLGEALVHEVASNRRILGDDGKVRAVRYTACADPAVRAEPVGTIDPYVKSITFYQEESPVAVLTFYATHPQSYYRTGVANPDFPGMARQLRQATLNGIPHIHFDGAGGNIGAGKFNDGSPRNRQILAERLADGMADAWEASEKQAVDSMRMQWKTVSVRLPVSPHLDEESLLQTLSDKRPDPLEARNAAAHLAWLRRCERGDAVEVSCLCLGPLRLLTLPGEPVVEYQLAAQKMRPDKFVAVAGYTDYGPGYICLEEHYAQGGYEPSPRASRVAPAVQSVLAAAIDEALGDD